MSQSLTYKDIVIFLHSLYSVITSEEVSNKLFYNYFCTLHYPQNTEYLIYYLKYKEKINRALQIDPIPENGNNELTHILYSYGIVDKSIYPINTTSKFSYAENNPIREANCCWQWAAAQVMMSSTSIAKYLLSDIVNKIPNITNTITTQFSEIYMSNELENKATEIQIRMESLKSYIKNYISHVLFGDIPISLASFSNAFNNQFPQFPIVNIGLGLQDQPNLFYSYIYTLISYIHSSQYGYTTTSKIFKYVQSKHSKITINDISSQNFQLLPFFFTRTFCAYKTNLKLMSTIGKYFNPYVIDTTNEVRMLINIINMSYMFASLIIVKMLNKNIQRKDIPISNKLLETLKKFKFNSGHSLHKFSNEIDKITNINNDMTDETRMISIILVNLLDFIFDKSSKDFASAKVDEVFPIKKDDNFYTSKSLDDSIDSYKIIVRHAATLIYSMFTSYEDYIFLSINSIIPQTIAKTESNQNLEDKIFYMIDNIELCQQTINAIQTVLNKNSHINEFKQLLNSITYNDNNNMIDCIKVRKFILEQIAVSKMETLIDISIQHPEYFVHTNVIKNKMCYCFINAHFNILPINFYFTTFLD